jgi:FkbM family methyltransferase
MNQQVVRFLKQASRCVDRIAQVGHFRFVREKETGLVYGEHLLKRLFAQLEFDGVFDIGANVGQYAQHLRSAVGYRGPIISFEPMPDAAARVRALAAHDASWRVVECAVDSSPGRATFNIMQGNEFSSLAAPSQDFEGRFHGAHQVATSITVDVITLADALGMAPDLQRGLLKLDTQGTELRLLRGNVASLDRFPALQVEVAFKRLYEGEETFEAVLSQLAAWGYELCALFPNNHGHFPHLLESDALFLRKEHLPALV